MATTMLEKVKDVRESAVPKLKELGDAVGPKVKEVGEAVGPKLHQFREAVGPKVGELRETMEPKVKHARRKVGFWIAGEEPRKPRRWPAVAAVGIGALVAYFVDPISGKLRRSNAKSWVLARFGSAGRHRSGARGEDAILEDRIRAELADTLDAGGLDIKAEDGVVFVRGTVLIGDQVTDIERRVRKVGGVRGVVNLIRLEGTPVATP